jgi:hypothetical protein
MSKTARILGTLTFVGTALALAPSPAAAQGGPFQFNSLTPCRVFDTRVQDATDGTNTLPLPNPGPHGKRIQGQCGVPTGAKAVTLNVTITQPSHAGDLRIFPSNVPQPAVSTLNYNAGEPALANGAIVPLAQTASGPDLNFVIGMVVNPNVGSVHVLVDVTGYFN